MNALPQIEKVKLAVTAANEAAVALYLRLGFENRRARPSARCVSTVVIYDLNYMELQLR